MIPDLAMLNAGAVRASGTVLNSSRQLALSGLILDIHVAHTLPTWLSGAGYKNPTLEIFKLYVLEALPEKSKSCVISVNEGYIEF